jgi:hypothetical protein
MDTHTKVLGWLYIVLGVLGMLAAGAVIVILVGSGLLSGDRTAISVLFVVAAFVGGFLTLVSLPGIIAGFGLLAYRPWARILALVLGILNLPGFPLGTVLGVYTLYVLLDDETTQKFASGS